MHTLMQDTKHYNQVLCSLDKGNIVSKLNVIRMLKLANEDPEVRKSLLTLAKIAADDNSEFDETVPGAEENDDKNNEKDKEGKKPQENPPPVPPVEAAPVAPAVAPVEGGSPEEAGARAAQAFIGPEIMGAAISGDPGAQEVVSRTAGQIAGAVAESAARSIATGAAGAPTTAVPAVEGPPVEGAASGVEAVPAVPEAPVVSPEQQVADQVIPNEVAQPAAVPTDVVPAAPGAPAAAAPAAAAPAAAAPAAAAPAAAPAQKLYTAEEVAKLLQQLGTAKAA